MNKKSNIQINKINIIANTIFFVLGFSIVFSTLGVLINSVLLENVNQFTDSLNIVAGSIIIIFGIFLILSTKINSLNKEKNFTLKILNQVIQCHLYLV